MNSYPCACSHRTHRMPPTRQRGVTLIELMVGMVIGLLATLVIAQVAIVFEGQKRNTTSGSDAQVNGALALQTLQRDIQLSGYGIATGGGTGCSLLGQRMAVVPPWNGKPMVPVRIIAGTDATRGSPDTLQVLHSDSQGASLPVRVVENHTRDGSAFVVDPKVNIGNAEGDLMVVVPPLPVAGAAFDRGCAVFNISTTPTGNTVQHVASAASGPWNDDGTRHVFPGLTASDLSYAGSAVGPASHLINLGTMTYREYSLGLTRRPDGTTLPVSSGSELQMRWVDSSSATWTASADSLFPQIVNLQAVYGRDTSVTRDNIVDAWDSTEPTTPDGWSRVIAVRIALVARSGQFEKDEVTATEPSWKPDGTNAETLKVDHLGSGTDWKHYRYKIFEAVVPLRNMLWQS